MRRGRTNNALSEDAIARGLERFRELIRQRGLRMSKSRDAIAKMAMTYEGHFSVEDLLRELHARGVRDAHLATIYRTIPLLLESGLVQTALVSKPDGQRYEAAFEREHHDHLVCTDCQRVVEYCSEALEALQREIAAQYGFELHDHVHEMRGRCRECRRRAGRAPAGRESSASL